MSASNRSAMRFRIFGNVDGRRSRKATPIGRSSARYLPQIAQTCTRLGRNGLRALSRDTSCRWCLGGDHSVAIGTVSGIVAALSRTAGQKIGLIWIDAHADMNTPETSPSGNVHGMPLACCIGIGPARTDASLRLRAQGGPAQRRASSACATSIGPKSPTCANPVSRRSRCARSMSAGCAPS